MSVYYSDKIRERAFSLFCQGMPMETISKKHFKGRPSKQTLWKWHNEEGWKKRKAEIDKEVDKGVDETLTQMRARQRRVCRAIQIEYIRDLKAGQAKILTSDIANIMKHELLLAGEATERTEGQITLIDVIKRAKAHEKALLKNAKRISKEPK